MASRHPDFKTVEASRPKWAEPQMQWSQTCKPDWKFGDGGNDGGASLEKGHVEIDPMEEGRPSGYNYKLLISAIVPRPVGFCSTISKDGKSTNLAPFSYFNVVNNDPAIFVLGIAGSNEHTKDSLQNLQDTGECCINIISEHFIEAANSTAINAPYGVSEWALSGLHPAPCTLVKASRVKEAIFSVEAKLVDTKVFESRTKPGKRTGTLAILEGVRFWAREDAVNEDKTLVDLNVLRPMYRLGGISYGRLGDVMEIPRYDFDKTEESGDLDGLMQKKAEGQ